MKVVIDTNVLISGLLSTSGPCGRILDLVLEGILQPCIDDRILEEYGEVVQRPRLAIPPSEADRVLDLINVVGERLVPLPLPLEIPDEDDLPFLEVAAAAKAILVTVNIRHFPEKARNQVTVLSPSQLLEFFRNSTSTGSR